MTHISVIFKCRWGLTFLSHAAGAISLKFQFKMQPSKLEENIPIFRPVVSDPLEDKTEQTRSISPRTEWACARGWSTITPEAAGARGMEPVVHRPRQGWAKWFSEMFNRGNRFTPRSHGEARLPSSVFTEGQGGGYSVVYWAKEVNLHPECFNNFRGYKYPSPAAVWFVGAVTVHTAPNERDTDFYLVQVSRRTLCSSLHLLSPLVATSFLLSSRTCSNLAMTSAVSHVPHQCFLKSYSPGKTRAPLDSPVPAAPRQTRDSWGHSLLFPGDVADPPAACKSTEAPPPWMGKAREHTGHTMAKGHVFLGNTHMGNTCNPFTLFIALLSIHRRLWSPYLLSVLWITNTAHSS